MIKPCAPNKHKETTLAREAYIVASVPGYSTVTLLARLRGWSTFSPFCTAMW